MAKSSYTKRADGRYQKRVLAGKDENGKNTYISVYGKTIKELEDNAQELAEQIKRDEISKNKDATFSQVAKQWLNPELRHVSETTLRWYTGIVNNHLDQIANKKMVELDATDLQKILNKLADENASKKTITTVRRVAISIMDFAITKDIIFRNKFEKSNTKVPKDTKEKTERQPITEQQKKLMLSVWDDHRMGVPALLMLYCGLRRGELIALMWNDVDLKKKKITVRQAVTYMHNSADMKDHAKTPAGNRTIDIPDILIEPLKKWKTKCKSIYVCPTADGELMSLLAWRRAWESYMHRLNIEAGGKVASRSRAKIVKMEPFTPHQLRHTYATMLYDADVDLKTAQMLLGHSDVKTTMNIYTHIAEKKKKKSIDKLNKYLNKNVVIGE